MSTKSLQKSTAQNKDSIILENFKLLLDGKGLKKYREIAEFCKFPNHQTPYNLLNKKKGFGNKSINIICKAFDVDVKWLITKHNRGELSDMLRLDESDLKLFPALKHLIIAIKDRDLDLSNEMLVKLKSQLNPSNFRQRAADRRKAM